MDGGLGLTYLPTLQQGATNWVQTVALLEHRQGVHGFGSLPWHTAHQSFAHRQPRANLFFDNKKAGKSRF